MAQTNYTPISLYYSTTASAVPTAANLVPGELAINTNDGKLYYEDSSGVVQVLATKGGVGTSSNTQVLYNSSGLVVGDADFTFNGTTVTMANDASISGLTVGRGAASQARNTAVGVSALASASSGNLNAAFGSNALQLNTGSANSAFGDGSLPVNTSGVSNSAFGQGSLNSNISGNYNVALGSVALVANTSGSNNVGVGWFALASNNASNNTAVGYQAGYNLITSGENTAVGYQALYTNTASGDNVAVGRNALRLSTGAGNTVIGEGGGNTITTGSQNTILGRYTGNQGGLDIRTASNYIVLSDGNGNPRGIFDGSGNFITAGTTITNLGTTNTGFITRADGGGNVYCQIASTGTGAQSAAVFYNGNGAVGSISTSGSLTSYNVTSDYRLKENVVPMTGALATVAKLKPVTYKWKVDGSDGQGFIAHELQAVVPDCVTGEKDAVDADGKPIYQGMDSSFLVATLVSAIQELKAEFDAYKATHP
jgi:hypothetical protein